MAAGVDSALSANPDYVRAASHMKDPEFFDAAFFGFSAREAEIIDPQQRVFLECAWSALEDAGCDPSAFPGAIGVFAGAGLNTYAPVNLMSHPELLASVGWYQAMVANDKDFLCSRVAYKLNLRGRPWAFRRRAPPRWLPCRWPSRACSVGTATWLWPEVCPSPCRRRRAISIRRA